MTAHCLSDLALEAVLLAPAPEGSPDATHLAACPACADRLAQMRREGEDFQRFVFPRTVEAVERAVERPRFRWPWVLAPAGALAAALVAVLLVRQGPPDDYEGVKGTGMALAVYVNGDAGARAVSDGAVVPASAAIRFKVQPARDCWLWIMSVDGRGEISRLYPPKGTPPDRRSAGPVPGGAVLDGSPGPERIYAVCAPSQETAWAEVRAAATVATGGQERLRTARVLGGSLASAQQASLLVEKQR